MGWRNALTPNSIPHIWYQFQGSTDTGIHWLNLSKSMGKWAKRRGVEIDRRVEFAKSNIHNITSLKPNLGSCMVIHKSVEVGISIMACQPQTAVGREDLRKLKAAHAALAGLQTTTEEVDIITAGPCLPAGNYINLNISITTFCAQLHSLLGPDCDYYRKL